jgi:Domain of unknown function (DUF4184)
MPFTLSHAAASLPFRRFKPVWPALVIGTFAPDLQYFILVSDEDRSGHYFPEVLLVTLPLALLVLWLFERFVKGPVIALLPSAVQQRLQNKIEPLSFSGWRQFGSIILWIAVGIATHVCWDQFTHSYSELATHWRLLRIRVMLPLGHSIQFAHLLQHISTIGGFLVLAIWFGVWYRRTPPVTVLNEELSPHLKVALPLTMAVVAGLVGYPIAVLRLADHVRPIKPLHFAVTVFVAMTLVFSLELLIYGLVLTMNGHLRRASGDAVD